jgi:hydrogenase nickel incorporation protein HypA/HybF
MHELSIAMNIIDIANEQAKINNLSATGEIEIEVVELSGDETDALKFSMEVVTRNTIPEKSRRIFIEVRGFAS